MTIDKLLEFEERYKPGILYWNLRAYGITRTDAVETARYYEKWFYEPLIDALKTKLKGGASENE